jgi:coenzyme F420-0:L-glutamate ligase/coenzyme F420-1:gamma-L-glutamate ligase
LLTLYPVKVARASRRFDLVSLIEKLLGTKLRNGDVLAISSKYVAISEGRIVKLKDVRPTAKAKELALALRMDERLCELVLRESDLILGGIPGFVLASHEGLLTPNAGIDKSNIEHGTVVLYPRRPEASARRIREAIKFDLGLDIGVVICDSRLMPTRRGTVGVALAAAGFRAVKDLRGKSDLFGNVLRVTSQALADDLSSSAQILMGESDEATPMVLIRGLDPGLLEDVSYPASSFSISTDEDVFLRSLEATRGPGRS